MFVDASALTAILVAEADADDLVARLERTTRRKTSPMAVWETSVAIARILGIAPSTAGQAVLDYLRAANIINAEIPANAALAAIEAFDRYGKGRHPARLNMGDCFAYACAKDLNLPLLFKGNDFAQTDIDQA